MVFCLATYLSNVFQMIWFSFVEAFNRIFSQLPQLLVGVSIAVLFLIVGWIIGHFAKLVVKHALNALKLDEWAKEHKLKEATGGLDLSSLAGSFVKWYIIIIFLTEATRYVGLVSIRTFMNALVYFAPIVLISLIILTLGVLFAKFCRNKIEATNHKFKKMLGGVVEAIIIFVSLLIALRRVGIDVSILENAFTLAFGAFVLVMAVVLGLSIAFAFKDEVRDFTDELRRGFR